MRPRGRKEDPLRTRRWIAGAAVGLAALARMRRRSGGLEGRTVLVTGGSRGLGLLLARRFGAEGCAVAICARDERELDAALRDLRGRGHRATAIPCDVARPDEVERAVSEVEERLGPVDVLVNNAAIIQSAPLGALGREDFERAADVIFRGALHATLAVLPGMRARGRGAVVNVTSIGGAVPVPHLLPYVSAKFALVGLSEGLRAELRGSGIRVTTVVPGLMRTGSPAHALFRGRREREYAWFALTSSLPLTSMSAERAARRIVRAAARGEPYVVLGWQARLLRLAYALSPGLVGRAIGFAGRALPSPPDGEEGPVRDETRGGAGEGSRGMELTHPLAPSFLTRLTDRAARRNNQYGGSHRPSAEHARRAGLSAEDRAGEG